MSDTGSTTTADGKETSVGSHAAFSGSTAAYQTWYIHKNSTATFQGAGYSFGNAGGWSVGIQHVSTLNIATRGIHQSHGTTIRKNAVGDCAVWYAYQWCDGGVSAQSDEGVAGLNLRQSENIGYFQGTVAATTGIGDRKPVLTYASGSATISDGAFLLNISKGTISGNVLAPSVLFIPTTSAGVQQTFLNYLPVTSGCLPISTACGISLKAVGAIPNQGVTEDSPILCTVSVTLVQIGGKYPPFIVGKHVMVGGSNYPEQSFIHAAVMNADGTQTLTMYLRRPNDAAIIFQEGIAGQYISFGANYRFSQRLVRSSYYALGSLTGSDLIYAVNVGGTVLGITLPQIGSEAATNDGGPNSDFNLYPGAEIVCVPVYGLLRLTLEQNNVNWSPTDVVENPHYPVWGGTAAWLTKWHATPANSRQGSAGFVQEVGGPGFAGGNCSVGKFRNNNPVTFYRGNGGPVDAPDLLRLEGPASRNIYISTAHEPGGAIVEIQSPNNQSTPNADVLVINLNWMPGGNLWFRQGKFWSDAPIEASGFSIKGTAGVDGTLQIGGQTVTVQGGLITGIA